MSYGLEALREILILIGTGFVIGMFIAVLLAVIDSIKDKISDKKIHQFVMGKNMLFTKNQ